MKTNKTFLAAFSAVFIAVTTVGVAVAQSPQGGMGPGMMRQGTAPGMMAGPGMMQRGMGPGMMGQGMGPDMMGPWMMGQGMGPGMMGAGRGMGLMFGARVVPMMNLSVEDVKDYLAFRLQSLGNKRLKLGEVKAEDGTITADIVTVDNSLVQRLKVDRRTGAIEYQD